MPGEKLIKDDLHRSTTLSVMQFGKLPTFTVELGTGHVPDLSIVAACAAGLRNVMRSLGMLDGDLEPIQGIKIVNPGYPVRRIESPRVSRASVVLHTCDAGDALNKGDVVARVCDIWGRPVGDGVLKSEYDGFVLGRQHGIYYYPGAAVLAMAIRDDAPVIVPYPKDYFNLPNKEKHTR
jgi:hypothetical protein